MATSLKGKILLSRWRLKSILSSQRFNSTLVDGALQSDVCRNLDYGPLYQSGEIDMSKWKKMDSRSLGISRSMISDPSCAVLKILQCKGFAAYLVGGCVRDLLLNRTPKDFDVITTADLKQIKKQFYKCEVVGQRFPICRVHVRGSVIEVSSFQTLARHSEGKEEFLDSQMPKGCDKLDIVRWRNSMHRDFTINSLFFDPFVHKIYDYNNAMKDLLNLKLRTLGPAQLSFQEDCARILRGLRIAARLGLSISPDTEIAIHKCSSSISNLAKSRILMEMNYMLSFGAAEASLSLLQRFHLLQLLLPFHAAYLSQEATRSGQSSLMLMKLFSNLDQLVTCDQPSEYRLWIALLAFHMALVNNPQHPLVVMAFASTLYFAKWEDGVKFAQQHGQAPVSFVPEITEPFEFNSDDELAEKVKQFALLVQDSVNILTDEESLHRTMARFPDVPCSGLVFVSKCMANNVRAILSVLTHDLESYKKGRKCFEMDFHSLGKGIISEVRLALGKIIMDTMGCSDFTLADFVQVRKFQEQPDLERNDSMDENENESDIPRKSAEEKIIRERRKTTTSIKRNFEERERRFILGNKISERLLKGQEGSQTAKQGILGLLETITVKEQCQTSQNDMSDKQQVWEEQCSPLQVNGIDNQSDYVDPLKVVSENKKHKKQVLKEEPRRLSLSSLFR